MKKLVEVLLLLVLVQVGDGVWVSPEAVTAIRKNAGESYIVLGSREVWSGWSIEKVLQALTSER